MRLSGPTKLASTIDQAERLLIPREVAFVMLGVGTTRGYQLINSGMIEAVKLGGKTLIRADSLRRFVEGLPSARQNENAAEASEKFRRLRSLRRDLSVRADRQAGGTE